MRGHNIVFHSEIRKNFLSHPQYPLLPGTLNVVLMRGHNVLLVRSVKQIYHKITSKPTLSRTLTR